MKGAWGFAAFLGLSVAVHAGILVTLPEGGTAGQGAGGADTISITASAAAYSGLIAAWERPPQVAPQPVLNPLAREVTSTPVSSVDSSIQRLYQPTLALPGQDTAPSPVTAPAPVPNPATVPNIVAPALFAPNLPSVELPDAITSDTARRTSGPTPALEAPDAPQPAPVADTEPHFEGATLLAAATSPRPGPRPEGLAPAPARAPGAAPQPSAPVPDRSAEGSGGGTSQGAASAPAPQPTASAAQIQSLVGQWGGQIQARIARSRPNVNATGRAVVQLAVAPSGQLVGLGIARSSGNPAVDQAALDAVRRAGRFPRAPRELTDASYGFSVPLTFQ